VVPLAGVPDSGEQLYIVMFETPDRPAARSPRPKGHRESLLPDTEAEHSATKKYILSLITEHEKATRALREANRDLVTRNDELQLMNADLLRSRGTPPSWFRGGGSPPRGPDRA
jgi:hypothetical protein